MSSAAKLCFLAALVACLTLLVASTFLTPVSNDAGAYLTIADGWLAGKLPYRDLFDHKTPGVYALYALLLGISGRAQLAVQLAQLTGQALTAALAAWIAWRQWSALAGALAGLLLLYGSAAFAGLHLTTEAWVALCIAAGLGVLLAPRNGPLAWQRWFLAGLAVGFSALFKQTGLLTLAAFGGWAWLGGGGWRAVLSRWCWLAAGCLTPIAGAALYFAAHGALDDLWRDAILINLTSYPRLAYRTLLRGNFVNLRAFPLLWLGLLLALVFARPRFRRSSPPDAPALLWLTLASGLLPLLHRSYGHYVLQALPAAAILSGAGLAGGWSWLVERLRPASQRNADATQPDAAESRPTRLPRALSTAVLAMVLLAVVALALIDLPRWPGYLAYTNRLVQTQAQVAAAIQEVSRPDEPILVLSDSPQLYFLSQRQPPTRWQYLLPVNFTPENEAELAALVESGTVRTVITDIQTLPWHDRLTQLVDAQCTRLQAFDDRFFLYNCRR